MTYSILALGMGYAKHRFFQGRTEQFAQKYRKAAQKSIMGRVLDAEVELSTLQSLCLLAFANFLGRDNRLFQRLLSMSASN